MKSKWYEYKEAAIALRKTGMSMTVIEEKLGIPRSTLSGWFKDIELSKDQQYKLMQSRKDGWERARKNAVIAHNKAKLERISLAEQQAKDTLEKISISNEIIELAFAMLYLGEGSKKRGTSIASSDPKILKFVTVALRRCFSITSEQLRCELHLRMDQNPVELKKFWSTQLNIPVKRFRYVAFDKRTEGKPTYESYKGVCVIYCSNIAIQRKLMYIYTLFCDRISKLSDEGA